jgi:hypothetical protein
MEETQSMLATLAAEEEKRLAFIAAEEEKPYQVVYNWQGAHGPEPTWVRLDSAELQAACREEVPPHTGRNFVSDTHYRGCLTRSNRRDAARVVASRNGITW